MGVDKHVYENLKFQKRYNFYQKLSYTVQGFYSIYEVA